LTATVTTGASAGNLTGTVTFLDGSTTLASGVALGGAATTATAVSSTAMLAVGKHPITASYSGDPGHTSSSSTDPNGLGQPRPPLMQDVLEGTSTSVASSANPSLPGQSVTLTATAAALGGGGVTPDGSITFIDGTTILQNVVSVSYTHLDVYKRQPHDSGEQGPASAATLNNPTSVAVDGAGNLYVADTGNNAIRMIASATGVITAVAGGGNSGPLGDGGPANAARLRLPQGVTLDAGGNLFIADTGNHRIRMVSGATGTISTAVSYTHLYRGQFD